MKSKNWSQYVIPTLVILCSLILLATLTFALGGIQWKPKGRTLEIEFRDVTGVKLHSPVRYAGSIAGSIVRIRYLLPQERHGSSDKRNAVRVTVQLDEHVPALPLDVKAGLSSETILGEKFIALSAGSPEERLLPDGAVIQGQDLIAFDELARSAQSAVENVNQILTRLNSDYPTLIPPLARLLGQGSSLLLQASNLVGNADGAITNVSEIIARLKSDYSDLVPKLTSLLAQGKVVATNADLALLRVNALIGRTDNLIKNNEDNLGQIVAEVHVVSQNLKVITTYTKALTATLGEKPSRLIWGGGKKQLPSEKEILESSKPVPIESPQRKPAP
jgi:phospholipid/cholesterol/gamma-HCH transport system substrate-binding protein